MSTLEGIFNKLSSQDGCYKDLYHPTWGNAFSLEVIGVQPSN